MIVLWLVPPIGSMSLYSWLEVATGCADIHALTLCSGSDQSCECQA